MHRSHGLQKPKNIASNSEHYDFHPYTVFINHSLFQYLVTACRDSMNICIIQAGECICALDPNHSVTSGVWMKGGVKLLF